MSKMIRGLDNGTILLGENFSVDGFSWKADCRIQSHIHSDHGLDSLHRSKSVQYGGIVLSKESKELLISLNHPSANFADYYNWKIIPNEIDKFEYKGETVELLPNGHILGSMQIRVTTKEGKKLGYSGDFNWPTPVLEVDELVIDATSPSPEYNRRYTASQIKNSLLGTIDSEENNPLLIIGHMGRLQEIMYLLSSTYDCPFLGTANAITWAQVYNNNGYHIHDLINVNSDQGKEIIEKGIFSIVFIPLTECSNYEILRRTLVNIQLSDQINIRDKLINKTPNGNYLIPVTDHADFEDTLQFIKRSKAKKVYTHTTKKHGGSGGKDDVLAQEIKRKLGIDSFVLDTIPRRFKGEEYY